LLIIIFFVAFWYTHDTVRDQIPEWLHEPAEAHGEQYLLGHNCSTLPGASDVVLVMKTGASEIKEKLPVHFETTFRCTPNFMVFSDMAQTFQGLEIHDSLDELPLHLDNSSRELKYYRSLQDHHQRGEDVSGLDKDAAWNLDKFKNIPILQKAVHKYPDAKWFVFIDADTSILWSTLLTWFGKLDPDKTFYAGAPIWIGDVEFAHGGSGYVISRAAAKVLAEEMEKKAAEYVEFATHECCGDMVIGKALRDTGVNVTRAWPMINGQTPATLDFSSTHWCYAAVSFHHMTPSEITSMWEYEQGLPDRKIPRYADIYKHFIEPALVDERDQWDSQSSDEVISTKEDSKLSEKEIEAINNFEGCREMCLKDRSCLQFSYKPGECGLSKSIRLGTEDGNSHGRKSGWDLQRIEAFVQHHSACRPKWILE